MTTWKLERIPESCIVVPDGTDVRGWYTYLKDDNDGWIPSGIMEVKDQLVFNRIVALPESIMKELETLTASSLITNLLRTSENKEHLVMLDDTDIKVDAGS